MSKYYQQIVESIREIKPKDVNKWVGENYLGSTHIYYGVGTLPKRKLAKEWAKQNKDITYKEFIELLDNLYKGKSFEEKTIASEILNLFPHHRKNLELKKIDDWLLHLTGWAEIDCLCQSSFPAGEILSRWKEWEKFLAKLNKDKNINRRRASLVLLCMPVRNSDNSEFAKLAFSNIYEVQKEKDILITKAVSWLLRSLIKNHAKEVENYLKENEDDLPKIALGETRRKLLTGKK